MNVEISKLKSEIIQKLKQKDENQKTLLNQIKTSIEKLKNKIIDDSIKS